WTTTRGSAAPAPGRAEPAPAAAGAPPRRRWLTRTSGSAAGAAPQKSERVRGAPVRSPQPAQRVRHASGGSGLLVVGGRGFTHGPHGARAAPPAHPLHARERDARAPIGGGLRRPPGPPGVPLGRRLLVRPRPVRRRADGAVRGGRRAAQPRRLGRDRGRRRSAL